MPSKNSDKRNKKYKLRKNQIIGSPDAETDDDLFDVFISISNVEEIAETRDQRSILIGRTGTGKSAILKYIKKEYDNVTEIAPEAMSLRYLSNSTVLTYFKNLGVNLILFYKVLWKHVFIVELLKLYFKDDLDTSKGRFKQIIQNLLEKVSKRNPQKERALKYLEKWSNDFWQETEYKVKSLEKRLIESFATSMNIKVENLHFGISDDSQKGETYLIEAKQKAESVIHDCQSEDLLELISIMKEDLFTSNQRKFYIIIDDLDKEWIEDTQRYELIGALVEVIKEFRQLIGVKIIIALRENLNEIVFSGIQNRGGQREKFKSLYSHIIWDSDELRLFLDKRLKKLADDHLQVSNAFYEARRNHSNGFDYVLERSYHRPRDIISFINHAIENANNKSLFTKDILSKAEPLYSVERFQALEDEWGENFGQLSNICQFLKGVQNGFYLKSLNEEQFEEVYFDTSNHSNLKGDLLKSVQDWQSDSINFISFLKKLIFILYRIGIIGIKKDSNHKTAFFYDRDILIERSDVSNKCKFYVHPSLYSYFKVNTIEQLPESDEY